MAIIATWLKDGELNNSTTIQIAQLQKLEFDIILVCATPDGSQANISNEILDLAKVIRKPNIGYDFGSWVVGIASLDKQKNPDEVLLLNDSSLLIHNDFGMLVKKQDLVFTT